MAGPQTWWKWRPTAYWQLALTATFLFLGGVGVVYAMSRDWITAYSYAAVFTIVSTIHDCWRVRSLRRSNR